MTFVNRKHFQKLYIIIFLVLLNNCQLKEPNKPHGINFLENREKTLVVGKTNQNDVIRLIGNPHSTSIKDKDTWIYFERTITRGKMIKLGQNVLKENNLLELKFDKYGILMSKNFFTKEDMNKIAYIDKKTENNISQPSFVGKFLSSMRQKMYGKRKF
jgi:outer membrane protein assembly factor BamE (lipoprotein component of BamABCDE complex)